MLFLFVPFALHALMITNNFVTNSINPGPAAEHRIMEKRFLQTNEIKEMRAISALLSPDEKNALYRKYSKDDGLVAGSFLLNLLLPGTGNLMVGDPGNGISLVITGGIGYGLLLLGALNGNDSFNEFVIFGGVAVLICEVLGGITFFDHVNQWNGNLKQSLILAKDRKVLYTSFVFGKPRRNVMELQIAAIKF